jgi:DNA-directed RNA polymerase beta' subunit
MSVNPTYYSEDVKKISCIEFSVFRNKDVKLYSAVSSDPFGIDLAESYENYEPKKGGLVDLRLGTCDIYLPCTTCGQNSLDCPGHFGHTILASPVFNFGFLNHLKNLLQCVCLKCSNLLVEKSDVQFKKALNKKCESRFKEIKMLTKNVNYCFHCGVPVPKIKREVKDNGSIRIMIERDVNNDIDDVNNIKKIKESLTPRYCYNILRNISDNDCYLLGFNPKMQRPEDLIIENFPIPPSIIRPTAKVDFMSASTMEDALTLKISDIITANKRVRHQIEKETVSNELSTYNQDIFNLLQYHIATFYDNDSVSLPRTEFKTGGRPTKSISDRIKGKTGRIRSNLMGKRVDFSGRTVITSDPYIDIDQVGIPKKMAMELTIPEEVTPYNIKYLSGLVKNGRDIYPGANFVLRINYRDGKQEIQKIDLKYRKKTIKLNLDDIVERHSVDGDYVLFNRQPTLHKPSMMGHKIQVIDNDELNTFRMNVSVCKPYNADFDGDEMNIHLAQSIQARNELKRIANVQYQIIGAKDSSPIIGCQQDTLSGAYMLTDPTVKLIGWEIANILCNTTSDTKFNIKMNKEYSGHEIFSHIIPAGINTTKKSGDKITLQITNGKLISGYLDKSALSFAKNSIIHFIWDKYGPIKTRKFIDDSQRLVLNYLLCRGQTVGLKDTVINEDISKKIQQVITNKILESKYQITQYENDIDQISLETIEASLSAELSAIQANIGQILMGQINIDNFFWTSAISGAKGNSTNVAQVSGVLGQNNVEGSRIKKKIEGRSLIYWHKDDDTPEARGFIKSSYLSGLKGFEFFYNAMAGREGLIDTAIKSITWETPIVIIENSQPIYIEIGKWIDNLLLNNSDKIQYMDEQNMELMDLPNGTVYVPTTDYYGNVSWGEISAITRHDPGNELYEIKTSGGRSVIVTASKSLLIWNENTKQFKEILTTEIKVGDYVPVTCNLCQIPDNINNIKLSDNKLLNIICSENNVDKINNYLELYSPIIPIFDNIMEANCYQMLCSRVGIVGNIEKTKTNHYIFNKLDTYKSVNDVMLDQIVEINPIDIKNHPKVYDLTIPSTFNFGLANGLQVRDTAQTGYIQRQLIKGLEDLSIKYDGTNRNARGIIIQTVYGENGINQSTQTELQFNILSMDNKTLKEKLGFSPEQIKKLEKVTKLSNKELTELNKKQCNKLLQFRDELRDIQTRSLLNYKVITEKFVTPVNLFRITQDYSNNKEHLELSPVEIYEGIESFLTSYDNRLITSMKTTDKFIKQDDRNLKFLLEVALNEYLAPVKCIFEYGLSQKEFQTMMKEIQMSFTKAIIEPGEMVGIIAAQSVGEPTSQMSNHQDTMVKIVVKNVESGNINFQTVKVGKLCDEIINANPELTINTGHVNSVETDLSTLPNEYYIVGVDSNERTHWNKISHVTRHPVNGNLMEVKTKSGRKTITTLSHSHLIRKNQTVEPITGYELQLGMRIPVTKHIDNTFINDKINIGEKEYQLDKLFGWFVGIYLAKGSIVGNIIYISNISEQYINKIIEFGNFFGAIIIVYESSISLTHKILVNFLIDTMGTCLFVDYKFTTSNIPAFAFTAPNNFKASLLQAYIDNYGDYQVDKPIKQIKVCSKNKQLISDIALLLNYFDIFCTIKEHDIKRDAIYNLSINACYALTYQEHIGTLLNQEKLTSIIENSLETDEIDKINGLGVIIAKCCKTLELFDESILIDANKDSIHRKTINKYIDIFTAHKDVNKIQHEITILNQAVNSNVIWDEIINIYIYTPDQTEYVYDFTVPGNQTFMVDTGIIVHNTLNTKHFAGVAKGGSANMGVSRILELVHFSKNIKTPQMHIYFNEPYATDRGALNKVVSYFKHLSIRHLISSAEVYYDAGTNDTNGKKLKADNVTTPFFINNQKAEISSLPFVFRIKMDMEKMIDKETTLLDIKTKFISYWYKNYTNLKNLKRSDKDVIGRISRCAILSNNITDKEQIIHIRFSMSSFNYNIITDFLKMVFDDITLKGIENIKGIDIAQELVVKFDKETGGVKTEKEYLVYTAGINIKNMRLMKGIDHVRTKCNDIANILKHYGIEAARQILIHELTSTYSNGGSNINQNHLSVLVDQMCHLGEIISIDRHGLGKIDMDPIARASFEKQMDHFVNAALFNEKDQMKSVSSQIAVGRVISGGTGVFDLLLDTKKLENSEYTEDETGGRITFTPLEEEPLLYDIMKYDVGKNDFFIPVS